MTDPQLYLVTPPAPDPLTFAPVLTNILDAIPIASVLLMPGDSTDEALRPVVEALRQSVQDRDIAFVIDGRPGLAAATRCDGVHTCPASPPYAECRQLVGNDAIVGYSCRNDRHDAMVHAELGADYIVFGEGAPYRPRSARTIELIEWWAELIEVPCVALDRIAGHNARDFVEAGADFLAIGPTLWDDPKGPVKAAQSIAAAIGLV